MRYVPLILSCLLLAVHHFRGGEPGLIGLWLTVPFALLFKRRWADKALQLVMLTGALEWALTVNTIIAVRQLVGLPYLRLALILGGISLLTAASGLLLETGGRRRKLPAREPVAPGLGAFLFAAVLMVAVQLNLEPAGLLAERFLPAAGWWRPSCWRCTPGGCPTV